MCVEWHVELLQSSWHHEVSHLQNKESTQLGWKNIEALATSCEELTHWKRLWCWEGLEAGGEGDDRGWDGWMASLTRRMWVWVNSRSWWWAGSPGMLRFMGLQRVGHDWATELNWTDDNLANATNLQYHLLHFHTSSYMKKQCVYCLSYPTSKLLLAAKDIINTGLCFYFILGILLHFY